MPNPRVLLVVSADDVNAPAASGPRKDYNVLAEALDAATIDRSHVRRSGWMRRVARWVGLPPLQAWLAFRERGRYDVILTDGEHIGIPLALMLKLARSKVGHVTIGHRITAAKKRPFFKWLKAHSHITYIALHAREQHERAIRELGIPADRLAVMPYQVDVDFW